MGLLMTWSRQNLQPPGQESSLRPVAAVEIFVTVYQLLKKKEVSGGKKEKKNGTSSSELALTPFD